MHCTDIRKLRSIIRKSCARSRSNPPVHRYAVHPWPRERNYERDYARPLLRGVSAAAAVRTLVSVVMVCRNLQMRATRVSTLIIAMLFTRSLLQYLYCIFLEIPFWIRILGQNILILSQKILNTNLVGWRHCTINMSPPFDLSSITPNGFSFDNQRCQWREFHPS